MPDTLPKATILDGGRQKAYRPLPAPTRAAALDRALAAYRRGDFFAAHEILEPAWMGTDDPAERALHQGLIKLAAAYVHAVRGNPRGIARNLAGARERLAAADPRGIDLAALLADIDQRLASDDPASLEPPAIRRTDR